MKQTRLERLIFLSKMGGSRGVVAYLTLAEYRQDVRKELSQITKKLEWLDSGFREGYFR